MDVVRAKSEAVERARAGSGGSAIDTRQHAPTPDTLRYNVATTRLQLRSAYGVSYDAVTRT